MEPHSITWTDIIKTPTFISNAQSKKRQLLIEYWLTKQFGSGVFKWKTLQHNGVLFPSPYKPHNTPLIYNGEEIKLTPLSEEYATLYAKYLDTEYIKNKVFNKNFWNDFKNILSKSDPESKIINLELCDFKLIYKYILDEKQKRDLLPQEEKDKIKQEKDELEKKYKTAIIDEKEEPVGNFRIEPPGIFIGRGCHPKMGKIKERILPENITINIGRMNSIPIPQEGHKWKNIIHDRTVEWLASWVDNISGKNKYVWLASQSELKSKSDIDKFNLAKKLKKKIKRMKTTKNHHFLVKISKLLIKL